MRFFLYSILLFFGCASDYKALRPAPADVSCALSKFNPAVKNAWYTASVDVVGKHLSGLLLIKQMEDSSHRVVFTNEAGLTFFDFQYGRGEGFKVIQIIPQLKKNVVINLLKRDFELVLGKPFQNADFEAWSTPDERFFGHRQKNETVYFITDKECASLQRFEVGSRRKRKVSVRFGGVRGTDANSIRIDHHTFEMVINLKKIIR